MPDTPKKKPELQKNKPQSPKEKPVQENSRGGQIQELDEALRALANQNQFFETLIRGLPGIFYCFNDQLEVIRWNRNVEIVTGYTEEEVSTINLLTLFKGGDRNLIRKSIKDVFIHGEGLAEATIVTKDGREIPHMFTGISTQINGMPYLMGMGLDISARKAAESQLRESEALYRLLGNRITEGVLLAHQNRLLFANEAVASMFGYSQEEILGKALEFLVAEPFRPYFLELYEALESGTVRERTFQARCLNKQNNEFWVEGRANIISWKGKPSVLLTARDITEAKLRELSMQEEAESLRRENVNLRSSIRDRYRFGNIIGKSPAMQEVYELILNAAAGSANVIIYGESGTGKELVARAIHKMSKRAEQSFVPVNCAAIPANLLESEFFGHRRGAFTGAHSDKEGFLDLANGGTLFLDEVGELDILLQVKLLRAIEGGGYMPVGSNVTKSSDFRIIAATHRNLLEQSRTGKMREDFFFRIHIIPINLPPLRQRRDDIPLLVEHFMKVYSGDQSDAVLPGKVLDALVAYDWPGNVRELQNVIQRYLTVNRLDFLTPEPSPPRASLGTSQDGAASLRGATENVEKTLIREALDQHRWNKSRTAEALGISRKTLFRKMKRFGLS
ncbi:MAG: sigma 54-interacting transcriptional regulator [Desulfatibacillum sp.]|nr:sigma 54-interacting transcriptional regulator [Desulfatibacillum sp.]